MTRIRVMLADDEDAVLDALTSVLGTDPSIDVVGTAGDAPGAIGLAQAEAPDVAILDLRMPGGGGVKATREIRRRSPDTRVIALSSLTEPDGIVGVLRAGAIAYVDKDQELGAVLRAIHRSVEGRASLIGAPMGQIAERLIEHQLQQMSRAAHVIVERIERAITGDALRIVYQPIVDIRDGSIAGVEALARFEMAPRRPPQQWFAEAAGVGMLRELELEAIRRALFGFNRLPTETFLSVNASPTTMSSPKLASLLATAKPERVVLEVTEGSSVEDFDELTASIQPLRDLGVGLAIDDVGAGFASLSRVVRLMPDHMKLDRTLVQDLDSDPIRRTLIERLMSFADEIGIQVIAEGVETEDELALLRELGVRFAQGFLLGRPGAIPDRAAHEPLTWPGRHAFRRRADLPPFLDGSVTVLDHERIRRRR